VLLTIRGVLKLRGVFLRLIPHCRSHWHHKIAVDIEALAIDDSVVVEKLQQRAFQSSINPAGTTRFFKQTFVLPAIAEGLSFQMSSQSMIVYDTFLLL